MNRRLFLAVPAATLAPTAPAALWRAGRITHLTTLPRTYGWALGSIVGGVAKAVK